MPYSASVSPDISGGSSSLCQLLSVGTPGQSFMLWHWKKSSLWVTWDFLQSLDLSSSSDSMISTDPVCEGLEWSQHLLFLREIEVNLVSSDTTGWVYDCLTHTMKVFMSYVWFMRIQVWCRGSCNPSPWFLHVDGVSFQSCHDLRQTMNYQRQWVEAFVVSKHIQCSPFGNFTRSVNKHNHQL